MADTLTELLASQPMRQTSDLPRSGNTLGRRTAADARQEDRELRELGEQHGVTSTLGAAWRGNILPQAWKTLDQKFSHMPEDGFDVNDWLDQYGQNIPSTLRDNFAGVRSTAEAQELADRITAQQEDERILASKGAGGVAAQMLAGMADIDAPLMFMSGGTYAAGRVGARVAGGALRGGASGVALGAMQTAVDPMAQTSDIVFAGLLGTGLGGAGGASLNRSLTDAAGEYRAAREGMSEQTPDFGLDAPEGVEGGQGLGSLAFGEAAEEVDDPDAAARVFRESDQSLGAGATTNPFTEGMSEKQRGIYDAARKKMRMAAGPNGESLSDLMEDMGGAEGYAADAGRRLGAVIQKTPYLRSLFDDVASGGTIMSAIAFDLAESPAGRARNATSAAGYHRLYERRLQTAYVPVDQAYAQWHKRSTHGIRDLVTGKSRQTFDDEVLDEMDARYWGDTTNPSPEVKAAADALDEYYVQDLDVKLGRDGEPEVDGSSRINVRSGHYRRQWDGRAMRRLKNKGHSEKDMAKLVSLAFKNVHPHLTDEHADMVGRAIIRRAIAGEEGMDTSMLTTLNSDGREMLRQALRDSGYSGKDVDNLLRALTGAAEERGKLASNKGRIDLDMRTSLNGLRMRDLINSNITEMTARNSRATAGSAALARKGITNNAARNDLIEAAMREVSNRGDADIQKHRETLEGLFSYFDSGPINGGVSPIVTRMKRLTNLVLLNQMGMTQLGETGAQIHAVGFDTWKRHAKDVFEEMKTADGQPSQLAQDLMFSHGRLGDEHLLLRPELQIEEIRGSNNHAMELDGWLSNITQNADVLLGKGTRLQGYISLFNHVKSAQQKIAGTSMADKIFQRIRDGKDGHQLWDIGIDPKRFQKYIDKGYVEFGPEGYTARLRMEKWDPKDADIFSIAIGRHVDQVVQRGQIGEDSQWWHTSFGAMMSHLKTFPLMAIQKQAVRNLNMGTPVATGMLLMGLATAGTAFYARQIINGRGAPSVAEAAKGAVGMSNMTGWFPMFWDPMAAALNLDDARFHHFGRHHVREGILPVPAIIPTLNRVGHIAGGIAPWSNKKDVLNAFGALPLVGNAYGMTYILNKMRKD